MLAAYRGYAALPGGASVAYLALGDRVVTLGAGAAVAEGWLLRAFDAESAELARHDERLRLPFQHPVPLPPTDPDATNP